VLCHFWWSAPIVAQELLPEGSGILRMAGRRI
jgi:hypothetical protein